MGLKEKAEIRCYNGEADRARVEDLERSCEVGPTERMYLFTDTMGDPICRIRNTPMHKMLVAEMGNELVGVIQGSIKWATLHNRPPPLHHDEANLARVGYILGLRVAPLYRRRGIATRLVCSLENWFVANDVDYAYMATEKDNKASVRLFVEKFRYIKFRTPAILVNPIRYWPRDLSSDVEIAKITVEEAEFLYRKCMSSTDFFPNDIDMVLKNKLSMGTWVAYPRGDSFSSTNFVTLNEEALPRSWAMISVWNSSEVFKLRLAKASLPCLLYAKSWRLMDRFLPCFKLVPSMPDFFNPFGFYFMYGVYHNEGPMSRKLVRNLCHFVHNMARTTSTTNNDECCCKVVVTEIEGCDIELKESIPHWKLLSCAEDLWCIKAMKMNEADKTSLDELAKTQQRNKALFVDPREV